MAVFLRTTIFVMCIAVLAGCSRERRDWQSAQTADTIEAYGDFLARHADSALAGEAEARVKQLGEERDWQQAATLDTLDAYQAYLRQHPGSKWAEEARIRVENFALTGALPAQTSAAAPAAGAPPVETAPDVASTAPTESAAPAAAPAHPIGHGVQLGAFSTDAKAHAEWQRISRAYGNALAGLEPTVAPVKSGAGTLYRLRAATLSEAKSRSICEALRAKRQACVVVLPVGK